MKNEINSANQGTGYLIRNGRTKEECYLQSIGKDPARNPVYDYLTGREVSMPKKRKWKCVESREEIGPRTTITSRWTADETKAMYFGSRAEAEKTILKWKVLQMAKAFVVQG